MVIRRRLNGQSSGLRFVVSRRWESEVAAEERGSEIERDGVEQCARELEGVAGGDEEGELQGERAVLVDGQGAGVEVGDEDDGGCINEL